MRASRRRFLMGLAALATAVRPRVSGATPPAIHLLPVGKRLVEADARMVETAISAFYDVHVQRLGRIALPRRAYYSPRRRYRAEKLLETLEAALPSSGGRILGLTTVDISTTKGEHLDWGILGLANVGGTAAVLSSFRCWRGARDARHARVRLGKVAVHELGHSFGLPHCTATAGCLMQDARGAVGTIDDEADVCPECRAKIAARGYAAGHGRMPW